MTAEDLGRRLLGECSAAEAGMDRVLKALRMLDDHINASPFNLAPFDKFFHPSDIATHEIPRPRTTHKPQIIELSSEESCTGKTHLLYLLTAIAILPQSYGDIELDGKNSAVIILDTDSRFDVQRLSQVMLHYILQKDLNLTDPMDLICRSLKHVYIFRPQSLASTISTLSTLQTYIFSKTRSSSQRPIHSIILDNLSTFYWQTRSEAESLHLETTTSEQPPPLSNAVVPNRYASLVQSLRALQQAFSCAIIATTHAFSFNANEPGSSGLRTLPAPWSTFPSVRLLVAREPVRRFALGMSVEEALKERAGRQAMVEKARFFVKVVGGSDVFAFSIQGDGIVMEEEE